MIFKKNRKEEMAISERELKALTSDLVQIHNEVSLPAFKAAAKELSEELKEAVAALKKVNSPASRRGFLLLSGATVSAGALLAACSSSSSTSKKPSKPKVPANYPANLTGDLAVVALAASLENLGVFAYNAGLQAAKAGKLGTVPPAVATFAETAMSQHKDHAAVWNNVLTTAGLPAVTETTPGLTPTVKQAFSQVTDVTGLAKLALQIENVAAQTYQVATTAVHSQQGIAAAATIQPVEMQHAAILYFVLGQYPVPNAFNPTNNAATVADLRAS